MNMSTARSEPQDGGGSEQKEETPPMGEAAQQQQSSNVEMKSASQNEAGDMVQDSKIEAGATDMETAGESTTASDEKEEDTSSSPDAAPKASEAEQPPTKKQKLTEEEPADDSESPPTQTMEVDAKPAPPDGDGPAPETEVKTDHPTPGDEKEAAKSHEEIKCKGEAKSTEEADSSQSPKPQGTGVEVKEGLVAASQAQSEAIDKESGAIGGEEETADKDQEAKDDKGSDSVDCQPNNVSEAHLEEETENKPKKHTRKKDVDPRVLQVRRQIQQCCRFNDLFTGMEAYDKAVSEEVRIEPQSFYNLLNLCDGLERSVHVGTPKPTCSDQEANPASASEEERPPTRPVDAPTRQKHAFRIKEHMDKLNLPLNETSFTALVKVTCRNQNFQVAEQLLSEAEKVQQCRPKLRLYSSLLLSYCESAKLQSALQIWKRLRDKQLALSEREYAGLMKCAVATGNAQCFEYVLSELADNVLVPSKEAVAACLAWFESAHACYKDPLIESKQKDADAILALLEDIQSIRGGDEEQPPSIGPVVSKNGWKLSSMCPIDTQTGDLRKGCLKGETLHPVHLSEKAWSLMLRMNESIVTKGQVEGHGSEFQGGRKGKKRKDFSPEERKAKWESFCRFLDQKGDIDVVIDGANVGYFETNFAGAAKHVDYKQIDWILQHFLNQNKKVLLFLHERHFHPNLMPQQYRHYEIKWKQMNVLFRTPAGMNDDWFWLHAALKYQCLVLTNDEMRDHHFQMLAPRMFLRWKERHQIHFSFGEWQGDQTVSGRKIQLVYPDVYSRRIQRVRDGIVLPLAKRGDENRFLDGSHIANDDEPVEETYVCIRPVLPEQVTPVTERRLSLI